MAKEDFDNLNNIPGFEVKEVSEGNLDDIFNDSPEDIAAQKIPKEENEPNPPKREDKKVKEEPEGDKPPKKTEKVDEQVTDVFDDEPEEGGSKNKSKEEEYEPESSISVLWGMKNRGLLDLEEIPDDITEKEAEDLIQDAYDETMLSYVQDTMKNLPPIVKDLVVYSLNGGSPENFIRDLYNQGSGRITLSTDMSKEANQELVMREMLKAEDYGDSDDIESHIEHLKDTGKLESISKRKFEKWKNSVEESRKYELENQRKRLEIQKQEERKFRDRLYETVNKVEDLGGLKLSKLDRRTLTDYMVTKTISTDNGGAISQFYADLSHVLGNEKSLIQLAKLVKSRNKDGSFNFADIEKAAETKVTSKVKDNLQRNGRGAISNKSVKNVNELDLISFLEQNNK